MSQDLFLRSEVLKEGIDISEMRVYVDKEMAINSCPIELENLDILKIYIFDQSYSYQVVKSIIRISLYEPKYIDCEIQSSILTKDQLYRFISHLNEPRPSLRFRYDDNEYPFTIWQMIIEETNRTYEVSNSKKRIPKDILIPDYSQLKTLD